MTTATTAERPGPEAARRQRPYAPSWVDHLSGWVKRLPAPNWVVYAALGLLLILAESMIQWLAGRYPAGTFDPFHIYFAGISAYFLAFVHYLDTTAAKAWAAFQPALDRTEPGVDQLEYQLTTLPARPTLLASLVGAVVAVVAILSSAPLLDQMRMANLAPSAPSVVFNSLLYFVNWCVIGAVVYHVVHQLRIVSRIYRHTGVDLFQLGPLYTFSSLSARTALGLAVAMYLPAVILPGFPDYPIWTIVRVVTVIVVGLTFVWPLLGIHRLLVNEKERMLGENARLLKATFAELHQHIESQTLAGIEDLNRAIAGLESEQKALRDISTWPWQPETPRVVVAAVMLPVVVWFIQWLLERILEP